MVPMMLLFSPSLSTLQLAHLPKLDGIVLLIKLPQALKTYTDGKVLKSKGIVPLKIWEYTFNSVKLGCALNEFETSPLGLFNPTLK